MSVNFQQLEYKPFTIKRPKNRSKDNGTNRMALIADWKIGKENQIVIKHNSFPEPFYSTGEQLKKYPIQLVANKQGVRVPMRVVPLSELETNLVLEEL